ncbi:hypothetical protein BGZ94_008465 [Podila epigama]|nr:hypothetical protein BGZ94_008465 [Podila epigama]
MSFSVHLLESFARSKPRDSGYHDYNVPTHDDTDRYHGLNSKFFKKTDEHAYGEHSDRNADHHEHYTPSSTKALSTFHVPVLVAHDAHGANGPSSNHASDNTRGASLGQHGKRTQGSSKAVSTFHVPVLVAHDAHGANGPSSNHASDNTRGVSHRQHNKDEQEPSKAVSTFHVPVLVAHDAHGTGKAPSGQTSKDAHSHPGAHGIKTSTPSHSDVSGHKSSLQPEASTHSAPLGHHIHRAHSPAPHHAVMPHHHNKGHTTHEQHANHEGSQKAPGTHHSRSQSAGNHSGPVFDSAHPGAFPSTKQKRHSLGNNEHPDSPVIDIGELPRHERFNGPVEYLEDDGTLSQSPNSNANHAPRLVSLGAAAAYVSHSFTSHGTPGTNYAGSKRYDAPMTHHESTTAPAAHPQEPFFTQPATYNAQESHNEKPHKNAPIVRGPQPSSTLAHHSVPASLALDDHNAHKSSTSAPVAPAGNSGQTSHSQPKTTVLAAPVHHMPGHTHVETIHQPYHGPSGHSQNNHAQHTEHAPRIETIHQPYHGTASTPSAPTISVVGQGAPRLGPSPHVAQIAPAAALSTVPAKKKSFFSIEVKKNKDNAADLSNTLGLGFGFKETRKAAKAAVKAEKKALYNPASVHVAPVSAPVSAPVLTHASVTPNTTHTAAVAPSAPSSNATVSAQHVPPSSRHASIVPSRTFSPSQDRPVHPDISYHTSKSTKPVKKDTGPALFSTPKVPSNMGRSHVPPKAAAVATVAPKAPTQAQTATPLYAPIPVRPTGVAPALMHAAIPTTSHAPVPTTVHAPVSTTAHAPASTTVHVPAPTTVHAPAPAHAPASTAVHTPAVHAPASTTVHVPAPTTVHVPVSVHAPVPVPASAPAKVPAPVSAATTEKPGFVHSHHQHHMDSLVMPAALTAAVVAGSSAVHGHNAAHPDPTSQHHAKPLDNKTTVAPSSGVSNSNAGTELNKGTIISAHATRSHDEHSTHVVAKLPETKEPLRPEEKADYPRGEKSHHENISPPEHPVAVKEVPVDPKDQHSHHDLHPSKREAAVSAVSSGIDSIKHALGSIHLPGRRKSETEDHEEATPAKDHIVDAHPAADKPVVTPATKPVEITTTSTTTTTTEKVTTEPKAQPVSHLASARAAAASALASVGIHDHKSSDVEKDSSISARKVEPIDNDSKVTTVLVTDKATSTTPGVGVSSYPATTATHGHPISQAGHADASTGTHPTDSSSDKKTTVVSTAHVDHGHIDKSTISNPIAVVPLAKAVEQGVIDKADVPKLTNAPITSTSTSTATTTTATTTASVPKPTNHAHAEKSTLSKIVDAVTPSKVVEKSDIDKADATNSTTVPSTTTTTTTTASVTKPTDPAHAEKSALSKIVDAVTPSKAAEKAGKVSETTKITTTTVDSKTTSPAHVNDILKEHIHHVTKEADPNSVIRITATPAPSNIAAAIPHGADEEVIMLKTTTTTTIPENDKKVPKKDTETHLDKPADDVTIVETSPAPASVAATIPHGANEEVVMMKTTTITHVPKSSLEIAAEKVKAKIDEKLHRHHDSDDDEEEHEKVVQETKTVVKTEIVPVVAPLLASTVKSDKGKDLHPDEHPKVTTTTATSDKGKDLHTDEHPKATTTTTTTVTKEETHVTKPVETHVVPSKAEVHPTVTTSPVAAAAAAVASGSTAVHIKPEDKVVDNVVATKTTTTTTTVAAVPATETEKERKKREKQELKEQKAKEKKEKKEKEGKATVDITNKLSAIAAPAIAAISAAANPHKDKEPIQLKGHKFLLTDEDCEHPSVKPVSQSLTLNEDDVEKPTVPIVSQTLALNEDDVEKPVLVQTSRPVITLHEDDVAKPDPLKAPHPVIPYVAPKAVSTSALKVANAPRPMIPPRPPKVKKEKKDKVKKQMAVHPAVVVAPRAPVPTVPVVERVHVVEPPRTVTTVSRQIVPPAGVVIEHPKVVETHVVEPPKPVVATTKVVETKVVETPKPVVVETKVVETKVVETPKPVVVETPKPVVVETPKPVIVETKAIETPKPAVVEHLKPIVIETKVVEVVETKVIPNPKPAVVEAVKHETKPVVVETKAVEPPKPVVVETKVVEPPKPVVVETKVVEPPKPVVVQQVKAPVVAPVVVPVPQVQQQIITVQSVPVVVPPEGYSGPIPSINDGETVLWVKKIYTNQDFYDSEDEDDIDELGYRKDRDPSRYMMAAMSNNAEQRRRVDYNIHNHTSPQSQPYNTQQQRYQPQQQNQQQRPGGIVGNNGGYNTQPRQSAL